MQVPRRKPKRKYFRVLQDRAWGSTETNFHYSEVRFRKAENLRHPAHRRPRAVRGSGGPDGASARSTRRTAAPAPVRSPARGPTALLDRCRGRALARVLAPSWTGTLRRRWCRCGAPSGCGVSAAGAPTSAAAAGRPARSRVRRPVRFGCRRSPRTPFRPAARP